MRRRLSYANVTATLALVFAMSGGALAANHYLITSTKQINPKVLKKLKGNAGKTGATGATGATGSQGKEGPVGKEGSPGKNGTNGTNFTASTTLASGQTLTGSWGVGGGTGDWMPDAVQFRIPLAAPLTNENYIASPAEYSTKCPGPGQAASGQLCVYRDEGEGTAKFSAIYNDEGGTSKGGPGATGFLIYFSGESAKAYESGDWAVTAP
jgi:Collagen triple helix repeat (20 copies)